MTSFSLIILELSSLKNYHLNNSQRLQPQLTVLTAMQRMNCKEKIHCRAGSKNVQRGQPQRKAQQVNRAPARTKVPPHLVRDRTFSGGGTAHSAAIYDAMPSHATA